MSAVTIPRDSGIAGLAASCRSVELAIAERDVTDRDGTMPKGGVLESSERTPLDQLVQEIHHCKVQQIVNPWRFLPSYQCYKQLYCFFLVEPRSSQRENQLSQR